MSDKTSGMCIRDVSKALGYPYLQANSPWLVYRVVLDVDRDIALTAILGTWHNDYVMPDPNWCAINPENGHGHVCYEIAVPVARHDAARQKPLKLLAALEHALTLQISADSGFSGLICKNPLHEAWTTHVGRVEPYDLPELSQWVDLTRYSGRYPECVADGPVGRNCAVFDTLRKWAYKNVRNYQTRDAWFAAVLSHAHVLNIYSPPLPLSEMKAIVKSVAKWTWDQFDIALSDAKFSKLQAHRGKKGGFVSGATRFNASVEQRLSALEMRQAGMTIKATAEALGVSLATAKRWLRG